MTAPDGVDLTTVLGPPDYAGPMLSDVVPAAALALGAGHILDETAGRRAEGLGLDREVRTAIVVLVDGLGEQLLSRNSGYTPFFLSLIHI